LPVCRSVNWDPESIVITKGLTVEGYEGTQITLHALHPLPNEGKEFKKGTSETPDIAGFGRFVRGKPASVAERHNGRHWKKFKGKGGEDPASYSYDPFCSVYQGGGWF